MFDCQLAILENAIARLQVTGTDPAPIGSRHPSITPFQAFAAADGPFVLAAGNDALFSSLATAIGLPELALDPRFSRNAARTEHWSALEALLAAQFASAPRAHWLALLAEAGVPAGPVNRVSEALQSPQVAARTMLVETHLPNGRPLKVAGNPVKLSGVSDPVTRPPAPALDADRAAILAELGL
jgi:CoA:oxalate CoA-transferase